MHSDAFGQALKWEVPVQRLKWDIKHNQSFTPGQLYMHWPLIDPLMRHFTSSFVQVRLFKPTYPQLCTLSYLHFSFLHPLLRLFYKYDFVTGYLST
jgi:hypothetical protein